MREDRVHQFFFGGFEIHRYDVALNKLGHFRADHVGAVIATSRIMQSKKRLNLS